MTDLAPPRAPIRARVSTVANVLDDLELDVTEMSALDALGLDLAEQAKASSPSLLTVAALAWLQARRSTHPGISWEDAESLITVALT